MGARCRAVEELDQVGRRATFRQQLKEGLEYPAAAEPPEPLPYAVPFAKLAGECAPGYVEREVRANLVYRDFTRVGAAKMPDAKTMGRWGVAMGPTVIHQIHDRFVQIARVMPPPPP